MTPNEVIERGRNAEALCNNSLLNEAFETVTARLTKRWLGTKREGRLDADLREELHARANAIIELRAELFGWIQDAITEREKIEREEKRSRVK